MGYWGYRQWAPYVSVAERRRKAARYVARLGKKGRKVEPVEVLGRGRAIATTFWGTAWCENLEAYAELSNRVGRGRTYVRNGSVIDLTIEPGKVTSLVSGSEIYEIDVRISPMAPKPWRSVVRTCAGKIDSVVELLAGRFDQGVMTHLCRQKTGLFPTPREIKFDCSCPDASGGGWMCKHVAATLYGVGVRLDQEPELLFRLRQVDEADLLAKAAKGLTAAKAPKPGARPAIARERLGAVFGIELDGEAPTARRGKTVSPVDRRGSRSGRGRDRASAKRERGVGPYVATADEGAE